MVQPGPSFISVSSCNRSSTVTHRNGITSADKVVNPTLATVAKEDGVVGVMAASEHKVTVAPGNVYGSAGAANILTITPTENKTVDLTVPQVTGATYYDVFYSTDAAPLWVARVTETQRAGGVAITDIGTVTTTNGSGWTKTAGKVNIRLVGTGISTSTAPFTVNNAYIPSGVTGVSCRGYSKAIIHAVLALTDMRAAPTLKIYPFISKNDGTVSTWYQGTVVDFAPGSAAGKSLYQTTTVDVLDSESLCVLVDTISGQGAAVTIYVELI